MLVTLGVGPIVHPAHHHQTERFCREGGEAAWLRPPHAVTRSRRCSCPTVRLFAQQALEQALLQPAGGLGDEEICGIPEIPPLLQPVAGGHAPHHPRLRLRKKEEAARVSRQEQASSWSCTPAAWQAGAKLNASLLQGVRRAPSPAAPRCPRFERRRPARRCPGPLEGARNGARRRGAHHRRSLAATHGQPPPCIALVSTDAARVGRVGGASTETTQ